MEDKKKETAPGAEPAVAEETEAKEAGKEQKTEETDPATRALAEALKENAAIKAELADSRDKYLRMLAEYDNYRKRTVKERETAYADAVSDTVNEILPVIDNLARAAAYEDASKISEGLALTVKQADAMLAKLNITETAKAGDSFDPNVHNAVMHIEDDTHGEGEIVEVFQRGYRRGDKIIRHAMIKVAN